ncbi:S-formylglutathione hydrolase [Powellomyces hirtus]|uniref:S-formylglutathione hydrolase n=1 Tax=Powellomyces hirtus TaxID=109895 RepID=A0A507E2B3_9FUNG|nr:S-formylglutathione hydrolase [Powellomyces hirtus]
MAPTEIREISRSKASGGYVVKFEHDSPLSRCSMKFSVFVPPGYEKKNSKKYPILYWLSGLTCNEDNFMQKAGGKDKLAELGIVLVCPDTSPRGLGIEGEDDSWDLGTGAGFYVDATVEKWNGYNMYSYITQELWEVVNSNFNVDPSRAGIFGHSMGGHGAIVSGLRNPDKYKSVSAFAPIANPIDCPWGKKSLGAYLGTDNQEAWKVYDSTEVMKAYNGPSRTILVDQGTADNFLKEQLQTEKVAKVGNARVKVELRMQDGYDHSYFFISTFINDHLGFHAEKLKA